MGAFVKRDPDAPPGFFACEAAGLRWLAAARRARLHGDQWSGKHMWTPTGVVLIDPAAHGGHRETELAMLVLSGCPFLATVIGWLQD